MPLLPAFATLLARAAESQTLKLAITVHYTRATSNESLPALPIGMRIIAGRPSLKSTLGNVAKRTELSANPENKSNGVYVGICGPAGLVEDAWAAEAAVDGALKKKVGGVEVHEE
jgi:ferric-chelate reductase